MVAISLLLVGWLDNFSITVSLNHVGHFLFVHLVGHFIAFNENFDYLQLVITFGYWVVIAWYLMTRHPRHSNHPPNAGSL